MTRNSKNDFVLQRDAMLVRCRIHSYNAKTKDKEVRDKAADENQADRNMLHVVRDILPKEALRGLHRNNGDLRTFVYNVTLPWEDGGYRLLPVKAYDRFEAGVRKHTDTQEQLLSELLESYQDWKDQAKTKLGKLYKEEDYLSVEQIKSRFRFAIKYAPVPQSNHFVADLVNGSVKKIRQEIEAENEHRIKGTITNVAERVTTALNRLVEKMREPARKQKSGKETPVFRDSIIGNIVELVELLPALNITNDPLIEKARQQVEAELAGINPEELRESSDSRKEVANKAEEISKSLVGYL